MIHMSCFFLFFYFPLCNYSNKNPSSKDIDIILQNWKEKYESNYSPFSYR